MREKTFNILKEYIKKNTDYNDLTAGKFAADCNVSPATISRYVREVGYEDFSHFKYALRHNNVDDEVLEKETRTLSVNIKSKLDQIEQNIWNLDAINIKNLNIPEKELIIVYTEEKYLHLAEDFTRKMNIIDCRSIIINNLNDLKNVKNYSEDKSLVLTLGKIPKSIYNSSYQYIEISNGRTVDQLSNVINIQILKESIYAVSVQSIIIQLVLDLIVEECLCNDR